MLYNKKISKSQKTKDNKKTFEKTYRAKILRKNILYFFDNKSAWSLFVFNAILKVKSHLVAIDL